LKLDSARQDVGRAIKCTFVFCAAEDPGEKGKNLLNFKFEILYSGGEVSAIYSKVIMDSSFT
jgi:hypothetical protein